MINHETLNDKINLEDIEYIFGKLYHKEKFDTEHILTLSLLMKIVDKMELEYTDLIGNSYIEFKKIEELKLKMHNEFYMRIYNKDKYVTKDRCDTCIGLSKEDKMELEYTDSVGVLEGDVTLSNADIHINESIKVTYED